MLILPWLLPVSSPGPHRKCTRLNRALPRPTERKHAHSPRRPWALPCCSIVAFRGLLFRGLLFRGLLLLSTPAAFYTCSSSFPSRHRETPCHKSSQAATPAHWPHDPTPLLPFFPPSLSAYFVLFFCSPLFFSLYFPFFHSFFHHHPPPPWFSSGTEGGSHENQVGMLPEQVGMPTVTKETFFKVKWQIYRSWCSSSPLTMDKTVLFIMFLSVLWSTDDILGCLPQSQPCSFYRTIFAWQAGVAERTVSIISTIDWAFIRFSKKSTCFQKKSKNFWSREFSPIEMWVILSKTFWIMKRFKETG